MSAGMFSRQNPIARPSTIVSMPCSRASAAADSAYGPAPITRSCACSINGPPGF